MNKRCQKLAVDLIHHHLYLPTQQKLKPPGAGSLTLATGGEEPVAGQHRPGVDGPAPLHQVSQGGVAGFVDGSG